MFKSIHPIEAMLYSFVLLIFFLALVVLSKSSDRREALASLKAKLSVHVSITEGRYTSEYYTNSYSISTQGSTPCVSFTDNSNNESVMSCKPFSITSLR